MQRWDALLQLFSAAHALEIHYKVLHNTRSRTRASMERIEIDYNEDFIKLREPKYFEHRTQIEQGWHLEIVELEKLFSADGELLNEVIEDLSAFIEQWQKKLVAETEDADKLYADYLALHKSMEIPGKRSRSEKRRSIVAKIISMLVTPFASLTIGTIYQVMNKPVVSAIEGQAASTQVSIHAIYWGLGIFVSGQILSLIVGRGKEK